MITVRCMCGETYQADEQHAGRRIRCNKCGTVLEIAAVLTSRDTVGPRARSESSSTKPSGDSRPTYPGRTPKPSKRRWLVAASLAGMLLLSWGIYRITNSPQEKMFSVGSRLNVPAIPAPVATVPPMLPACHPEADIRPWSGAELGGGYRGGLGSLRVRNGTDFDAVAVLIDDTGDIPRRAIFIRTGESGAMTSVPPGRYRLRFQLGSDWLAERRFCRSRGTSEFDGAFSFEEIESGRGTKYSVHEVTLHAVPHGTARTHVVLDERFELPSP